MFSLGVSFVFSLAGKKLTPWVQSNAQAGVPDFLRSTKLRQSILRFRVKESELGQDKVLRHCIRLYPVRHGRMAVSQIQVELVPWRLTARTRTLLAKQRILYAEGRQMHSKKAQLSRKVMQRKAGHQALSLTLMICRQS